jgi:molybdate transport system ATP-binding protein
VLEGRIAAVGPEHNGIVDVTLAVGSAVLRSRITGRAARQLDLAPGLRVYALVKAVSLGRRGAGAI